MYLKTMTKVVGVRLTEYQISKLKEIYSGTEISKFVRELIDREINEYNRAKYERFREDKTS